jgi:hypothetical protein
MDAEQLVRGAEVGHRAESLRADEDAPGLPPEGDFTPPGHVQDLPGLEGRAGDAREGQPQVGHPEPFRQDRAVARVAVEELEDAGRLAQPAHPLLDAGPVHRVDEPHPAVGPERVRGALQERRLGRDPAEAEVRLVAEGDRPARHASASLPVCRGTHV